MVKMNQSIRSFLFAALIILSTSTAFAQPNVRRDTTHYNDEELYTDDLAGETPGYSWIGGGLIIGLHMPSLNDLNSGIAQKFIKQDLKEQSLFIGGQGFIPLPWVKNLRIGGVGLSGSSSVCCVPDTVNGQPVARSLTYHIGYGALTLDYSFVNTNRFHILGGFELGLGDVEIIAQQAVNRDAFDITNEFSSGTFNITHNYHAGLVLLKPQVEFEYAPLKWMMLRLGAGYQLTFMGTWKADDEVSLGDAGALTNVNGNGPFFHFGLFVGFF
jgi:hypothetical protein